MDRDYTVFISHAGPDKDKLALPLHDRLQSLGIPTFTDKPSLHPGDNATAVMDFALSTAHVGVFILSPDFPARVWTMRELHAFQRREQDAVVAGTPPPRLVPVFYRLDVHACRDSEIFSRTDHQGRSVFVDSGFIQRVFKGHTSMRQVADAMALISRRTGVENTEGATNDDNPEMHARREALIDRIVEAVVSAVRAFEQSTKREDKVVTYLRKVEVASSAAASSAAASSPAAAPTPSGEDTFAPYFEVWPNPSYVWLDLGLSMPNDSSAALAKSHLLHEGPRPVLLLLQGMPGVGKTTYIRALCHDPHLRSRFSDGVYLISLGADATSEHFVRGLRRAVRNSGGILADKQMAALSSVQQAVDAAARWFADRRCLFLLDDVWNSSQSGFGAQCLNSLARIVVAAAGRAALVATTREKELVLHKAITHKLQLTPCRPRSTHARSIFLRAAFDSPQVILDPATELLFGTLLDACAGLPVALAVTGRTVGRVGLDVGRDPDRAIRVYCSLQENTVDVLETRADDYTSLRHALSTSLAVLRREEQEQGPSMSGFPLFYSYDEMYRSLCILEKQKWVPLTILCRLWRLDSGQQTSVVVDRFSDVGLLDVHFKTCGEVEIKGVRLHDLVHDFAWRSAEAVGEVHTWHTTLLQNYNLVCNECDPATQDDSPVDDFIYSSRHCRPWWTTKITLDNYIDENLVRHLVEATCLQEAAVLLGRPQWIVRQLQSCGILLMERDFLMVIQRLESEQGAYSNYDTRAGLALLLSAVRMSVIAVLDNPGEIFFQLCARLIEGKETSKFIKSVVQYSEKHAPKPFLRPITACLHTAESLVGKMIHCRKVRCVAVLEEEGFLFVGTGDGKIWVFDENTGEAKKAWQAHSLQVTNLSVTRDARLVVSSSQDKTVKVFDWANDCAQVTMFQLPGEIWCIEVTLDSKYVIVACEYLASLWDIRTGQVVNRVAGWHPKWTTSLAMSPDESTFASGSFGGEVRVWRVSREEIDPRQELLARNSVTESTTTWWWLPRFIQKGYEEYMTRGRKGRGGTESDSKAAEGSQDYINLAGLSLQVKELCFTPDGKQLLSASSDCIKLWNVEAESLTLQEVGSFGGPFSVLSLSTMQDGTGLRVISCGRDGKVRMNELDGRCVRIVEFASNGEDISFASTIDCGQKILWGETDSIRIADMADLCSQQGMGPKHENNVMGLCMSPDGTRAVSAGLDNKLMVWDAGTGLQVGDKLEGHERFVDGDGLGITPDGRWIVSASKDANIIVWDLHKQTQLAKLEGHERAIQQMKISLDGKYAISGGSDTTVRVWDLEACNGRHTVLDEHESTIRRLYLAANGLQFVSLSETEGMLWDLAPLRRMAVFAGADICYEAMEAVEARFGITLMRDTSRRVDGRMSLERDDWWRHLMLRVCDGDGKGEVLLASLDSRAYRVAYAPATRTVALGLGSGQVSILRLELGTAGEREGDAGRV